MKSQRGFEFFFYMSCISGSRKLDFERFLEKVRKVSYFRILEIEAREEGEEAKEVECISC